ncbi:velvet factor-domain-containing protein [Mycena albidolilacea]|uniref:Velvet factor-domain-containing protein n=1 Tax=Mycena albidolilacea TaxID=1033008 RepID=A0AAD7EYK6_9AGAR|nr:velvet factor-domain-containing protein [Mycena albidolilacea]
MGSVRRLSVPRRSPANLRHELLIRQMPVEARASAKGTHERRTLDPLPAVELKFYEPAEGDAEEKIVEVPLDQLTGHALFAELVDAESNAKIEYLPDGKTEALCGLAMSSLFRIPDEDERPAFFFAFPELGVRATGKFKFRFSLSLFSSAGCSTQMAVYSDPFKVVTAASYGGVHNATPLTEALNKFGGARARIRKKATGANPRNRTDVCESPSTTFVPSTSRTSARAPRSTKRGRTRRSECSPRRLLPPVYAPQPRHLLLSSRGALAAHLMRTAESGGSSASACPEVAGPFEFQHSVLPLDLNTFAPDAVVPGETWAAAQPGAFDFLADWFSDGMVPVILDDEMLVDG